MWELIIKGITFYSVYTTQYSIVQDFSLPGNPRIAVNTVNSFYTPQYLLMAYVQVWIAIFVRGRKHLYG